MQKCNPFYRLNNKLKDESGVTLVELLAVLSILSVFILLAGSIHIFGQKQFASQTESASQANDFSYALTIITTEVRAQAPDKVADKDEDTNEKNIIKINGDKVFWQNGEQLMNGGTPIADGVGNFTVNKSDDHIVITISKINHTAADKNYHTKIYFRGEPDE